MKIIQQDTKIRRKNPEYIQGGPKSKPVSQTIIKSY